MLGRAYDFTQLCDKCIKLIAHANAQMHSKACISSELHCTAMPFFKKRVPLLNKINYNSWLWTQVVLQSSSLQKVESGIYIGT